MRHSAVLVDRFLVYSFLLTLTKFTLGHQRYVNILKVLMLEESNVYCFLVPGKSKLAPRIS